MKTQHLMLKALCAFAAAAAVSMGCTGLEPYAVDAPADLADKIAEYQAEKQAGQSDDYTEITITTAIAGAEDNSAGWWTEFSQYFLIPSGKKLVVEFENYGSGANNWNNWNVCVATPFERGADGYSEYFVLRSDWYGWGNADYNGAMIEFDYGGQDVNWDEFREKMQGAYVTMSIDHARAGVAFLEVKNVAADGFTITEKYNQKVSATEDIEAFLICDASHFNIKKAYLVPSEIAEIPDEDAASITVKGLPASVEVGASAEDILASAEATVTFTDNSSAVVPLDDVNFAIDETFTATTGKKTLVYSYSKTKQGNFGKSVAGYAQIEVTNPVASLEVTKAPVLTSYYVFDQPVNFYSEGIEVTATYADGTTGIMDNASLTFGKVQPVAGTQGVEVSYAAGGKTITTTCEVTGIMGTASVGLADFTNGWWTTFSEDAVVPAGESKVFKMQLYSDNLGNWHSPCVIMRRADLSEYCVVRMDNFGWGDDNYAGVVAESNWNWDAFMSMQNMSMVTITVTNNGDGTAEILYNVTYPNGEEHFQKYSNIIVDSADLQTALVTEESYLVLFD
ncbi:MAG: hypothetical protein IJL42_10645 [Bacteroidales bacterium]|nr:hypothetical protein [Bacteroidales bacterium]